MIRTSSRTRLASTVLTVVALASACANGSTPVSAQVMAMGGDATKLKAETQALAKTVLEKL